MQRWLKSTLESGTMVRLQPVRALAEHTWRAAGSAAASSRSAMAMAGRTDARCRPCTLPRPLQQGPQRHTCRIRTVLPATAAHKRHAPGTERRGSSIHPQLTERRGSSCLIRDAKQAAIHVDLRAAVAQHMCTGRQAVPLPQCGYQSCSRRSQTQPIPVSSCDRGLAGSWPGPNLLNNVLHMVRADLTLRQRTDIASRLNGRCAVVLKSTGTTHRIGESVGFIV